MGSWWWGVGSDRLSCLGVVILFFAIVLVLVFVFVVVSVVADLAAATMGVLPARWCG